MWPIRVLLILLLLPSLASAQLTRRETIEPGAGIVFAIDNSVGGNDTYTACPTPAITAYPTLLSNSHLFVIFTPLTNNTGAATLNLCTLGAVTIVATDGSTLANNVLVANRQHLLIHNGTNFVHHTSTGGGSGTLSGLSDNCNLRANGTADAECGSGTDDGTTVTTGSASLCVGTNCATGYSVGIMRAYFDAGSLTPDGTNCAEPAKQTLNSGPIVYSFSCADSGSSIFHGKVQLPRAINTATFKLTLWHGTTETITFAGDFSAQCRAAGTAPNSTWGTAVAADVAITTANNLVSATTASVTPNGTCSAGSTLFFRYVVDAANFSANAANAKVIEVFMEQAS